MRRAASPSSPSRVSPSGRVTGSPPATGRGYWAAVSLAFMVFESLIGAALVIFQWVDMNVSLARALVQPVHLANTYFLMGALACAAWWSGARRPAAALGPGRPDRLVAGALAGLIAVSAFGTAASSGFDGLPVRVVPRRCPQRLRGRRPLPDSPPRLAPRRGRRLRGLSRLAGAAARASGAGRLARAVSSRGGGLRDGAGRRNPRRPAACPHCPPDGSPVPGPRPLARPDGPSGSTSAPTRPRACGARARPWRRATAVVHRRTTIHQGRDERALSISWTLPSRRSRRHGYPTRNPPATPARPSGS